MQTKPDNYPWYFFAKFAKYHFFIATLTIGSTLYTYRHFTLRKYADDQLALAQQFHQVDHRLLLALGGLFFAVALVTIISAIRIARPLKLILDKVAKIENALPFDEKLRLFYKKSEWSRIESALTRTEMKLQDQLQQMNFENQKTATLLESLYDAILAVDTYQNSLFYNSKFEKNFIDDKTLLSATHTKLWKVFSDFPQVVDCYLRCINTKTPQSLNGFRYHQHFYDLSVAPLTTQKEKVSGAVGVFHDVTESKLTEQMRVDFVANVSHEIRTPLTSITGYAQVLQSQISDQKSQMNAHLSKILFNAQRLLSLFNDLLNLSVIESQNQLQKKRINLKEMIESIADSLKVTYREKGIKILSDLKHPYIWVDKKLMEQALINLIDNACKYTFNETAIIVSNFLQDDKIVISISDSGPGISKEHLDRIFERFYRVDSSRSNKNVSGTGLGLSIVKHIVRKHQGKVWAQSEASKGTIFFIELPCPPLVKDIEA